MRLRRSPQKLHKRCGRGHKACRSGWTRTEQRVGRNNLSWSGASSYGKLGRDAVFSMHKVPNSMGSITKVKPLELELKDTKPRFDHSRRTFTLRLLHYNGSASLWSG
eukprot:scaffold1671_cov344-Pavlova_lutheri.AAC.18